MNTNLEEHVSNLERFDDLSLLTEIEKLWRVTGTADRDVRFALCFAELRRRMIQDDEDPQLRGIV